MAETKLKAERRQEKGKGAARKLRAAGRVPGVLYGHGQEAIPLSVDARELLHLFHQAASANVLVDLMVDGKTHLTIPREVQRDHIRSRFVHVDFLAVRRDETITVNVEIVEVGEAPGVKAGGVIEHHLRELHVECFPQDVPERIEADVSGLDIGDMLHVSDLAVPKGVSVLTNPEEAVLSVITPAALRTEAELLLPGEEAPEVEAVAEEGAGEEPAAPAPEEGGEG
ncbi:MAG: 50S ribosomal protein L25/general stress protein Ctc [Actinobacteria bacterium]|nr:50S ribosomal protein L25/general stress protein Ctc [Actinomycetota bacterium]